MRSEDVLALHEAHLQVELRELRLAVGAKVLIAEAARNLEVALEAGDHQELLELLGRLRQRIETAGVHTAGHKVVAGALRRALDEDRRLNLEEIALVQEVADVLYDAMAQGEVTLHAAAAQVQVAIAHAQYLVDVAVLVDVEGRRQGCVEHLQGVDGDLHLTGCEAGVHGARRPRRDLAINSQDPLTADPLGVPVRRLDGLGVDDDLHGAAAVAQVYEDEAAMVAAAVDPARQRHPRAGVGGPQRPAVPVLEHEGTLLRIARRSHKHGERAAQKWTSPWITSIS